MNDELFPLRDKTAVVGVGTTAFTRRTSRDRVALVAEAFGLALEDAGLDKSDIDGLIVSNGPDCDRLAQQLGLEVEYAMQTWAHGRMSAAAVQLAAMVVHSGMAKTVAILRGITPGNVRRARTEESGEAFRPGSGPHWEHPQYGWSHQGGLAAMSFRRYLHLYGGRAEDIGQIAVAQRQWAVLHPGAVYREPLTMDDYLQSRLVIDPLRLYDFAAVNSGGVAMIVTTIAHARDLRQPPALISGMQGMRAGRQDVIFAMPGLGVGAQDVFRYEAPPTHTVYQMAGLARQDVDVLQVYDSFSPEVLYGLEQFGFCGAGESLGWIQDGRTAPGGELPVNTHGGHLSGGMVGGWAHLVEAVRQVRRECGERQVKDARVAQYIVGPFSSVIFTRQ